MPLGSILLFWALGLDCSKGKKFFTTPKEVTELPCGCKRNYEDHPFDLERVRKGWVHLSHNCKNEGKVFQMEDHAPVLSRRETMRPASQR